MGDSLSPGFWFRGYVKRMRIGLVGTSGNASHIIVFGMFLDRIWAVTLAVLTEGDWFTVNPRE